MYMYITIENDSYISDYAPSFEESDKALQTIIDRSTVVNRLIVQDAKDDEFQLKPLNQILLNFIWISLKVSATLQTQVISVIQHILNIS